MNATCNFKRIEKKYLLSETRYEKLFRRIGSHLKPDEYGRSTVMSLYLDTPDRRMIRNSIEDQALREPDHVRDRLGHETLRKTEGRDDDCLRARGMV